MKLATRLLIVGAVVIAAIKVFQYQEHLAGNVIGRVKTKDPEQIVIAAALTVGLGLISVVAAQAIRSSTS